MQNDALPQLIEATSEILGLETAVIEKDYYVTQVIQTLSGIENDYFSLVFGGGTCLAKAHKMIKRMSEDIDFKIQLKSKALNFSRTRLLKELKQFRTQLISKQLFPNYTIGEPGIRNEGKYIKIELHYPTCFSANKNLRPHILLEFTLSDAALPVEYLSVKSLIEETLQNTNNLSKSIAIPCASVDETAIEKWVGLTRRIAAIDRGYQPDDSTLIRHLYDINEIQKQNQLNDHFFALANTIIKKDAQQFTTQHPEYSDHPANEIRQSMRLLKTKPIWKERYQAFIQSMVYDNESVINYEETLYNLEKLSTKIIKGLN